MEEFVEPWTIHCECFYAALAIFEMFAMTALWWATKPRQPTSLGPCGLQLSPYPPSAARHHQVAFTTPRV